MRALWEIHWYNTDSSLRVGERTVFQFCGPDVEPKPGYDLCFEDAVAPEEDVGDEYRLATVAAIEHRKFGALDEVDTSRFGEYTFRFSDGRWVTIDTEQAHGVVLAASPDFTIDRSDPDWTTFMERWDHHNGWDLDVILSDVVVSSAEAMQALLDASQGRKLQAS